MPPPTAVRTYRRTDGRTDAEDRVKAVLGQVRSDFFIVVYHNRMSNADCAVHRRGLPLRIRVGCSYGWKNARIGDAS